MVNWVIGTRGINHDVERFIRELSSKYLPFEWKNNALPHNCPQCGKENLLQQTMLQVRVSPIQLWDISFPEQHSELMAATLFQGGGKPINAHHKPIVWGLRKLMGVEEIPQELIDKVKGKAGIPLYFHNIEIWPVGMKKDSFIEGVEQI